MLSARRTDAAAFAHDGGPALQPRFPAAPPSARAVAFDQVVLGHLPVLAAAWLCQYARQTARDSARPVALLRLWKSQAYVDVFGAPDSHAAACHSLPDAIAAALSLADTFILASDDATDILLPLENSSVTLLSSADQVGTVAAFRLLKSLAARLADRPTAGARTPSGGPGSAGAVRIAIMGSDESVSAPAWQRLSDAAKRFLSRELVLAAYIPRIDSHPTAVTLFAGPCPLTPAEAVEEITRSARLRSQSVPEPPAASPASRPLSLARDHDTPPPPAAPAHHSPLPPPDSRPSRQPSAPATRPRAHSNDDAPGFARVPLDPADLIDDPDYSAAPAASVPSASPAVPPSPFFTPEHDTIDIEVPSLASHVPGMTPIPAQCPYARDVELALDSDGRPHLLVRAGADAARSELLHLTAAAAWLTHHAELLHAAGVRVDAALAPVFHVFTHDARRFTSVVNSPVRLHLLSIVSLDGRRGWFCADLN